MHLTCAFNIGAHVFIVFCGGNTDPAFHRSVQSVTELDHICIKLACAALSKLDLYGAVLEYLMFRIHVNAGVIAVEAEENTLFRHFGVHGHSHAVGIGERYFVAGIFLRIDNTVKSNGIVGRNFCRPSGGYRFRFRSVLTLCHNGNLRDGIGHACVRHLDLHSRHLQRLKLHCNTAAGNNIAFLGVVAVPVIGKLLAFHSATACQMQTDSVNVAEDVIVLSTVIHRHTADRFCLIEGKFHGSTAFKHRILQEPAAPVKNLSVRQITNITCGDILRSDRRLRRNILITGGSQGHPCDRRTVRHRHKQALRVLCPMEFIHCNGSFGVAVDPVQMGMVDNVILTVPIHHTAVAGTGSPGPVAVRIKQVTAFCLCQLAEGTHRTLTHGHTYTVGLLIVCVGRVKQVVPVGHRIVDHVGSFIDRALVEGNVLLTVLFQSVGSSQCLNAGVVRSIVIMECHYINAGLGDCLCLTQVMAEVDILVTGLGINEGIQVNDLHITVVRNLIQGMGRIHPGKVEQRLIGIDLSALVHHYGFITVVLVVGHKRTCRRFRNGNIAEKPGAGLEGGIIPVCGIEHIVQSGLTVINHFRCPVVGKGEGHRSLAGGFIVAAFRTQRHTDALPFHQITGLIGQKTGTVDVIGGDVHIIVTCILTLGNVDHIRVRTHRIQIVAVEYRSVFPQGQLFAGVRSTGAGSHCQNQQHHQRKEQKPADYILIYHPFSPPAVIPSIK